MDLRWRLVTLLGSLLLALVLATSGVFILSIHKDTAAEVQASERLARLFLLAAQASERGTPQAETRHQLESLLAEGPIRHLRIRLDGTLLPTEHSTDLIARMLQAPQESTERHLQVGGLALSIAPNPYSELQEKLSDALQFCLILFLFSMAALLLTWISAHRALHPVRELEAGLARLAHGASEATLPTFALQEFQRIADAINQLVAALSRSKAAELALAQRLIQLQDDERRTLARELHDEMGQTLTALGVTTTYLERNAGTLPLSEIVTCSGELQRELKTGRTQLRAMLRQLNPHDLDAFSLPGALRELVTNWQKRISDTVFTLAMPPKLPHISEQQALTIYRLVQEALTNVVRHAQAAHCTVTLSPGSGEIGIQVCDDGCGMGKATPGIGLTGMLARLDMLGGKLELSDLPTGGLCMNARLPLPPESKEEAA